MCNKEQLVGYLYGELAPAERQAFEAHLAGCAECRGDVQGLEGTRAHLASWTPPEAAVAFRVVDTTRAPAPRRPSAVARVPRWALAAAASLLMVAGAAALANVRVTYGADGSVTVRTGWAREAAPVQVSTPPPRPATTAAVRPESSEALERQVRALVQRVAELEAAVDRPPVVEASGRPGVSFPELRRILAENEARQRNEMAAFAAQIWKDFTATRANDLARVQSLGQAQGLTNLQLQQQRDRIESLRLLHVVSQQK
jgi:hypothetical protein